MTSPLGDSLVRAFTMLLVHGQAEFPSVPLDALLAAFLHLLQFFTTHLCTPFTCGSVFPRMPPWPPCSCPRLVLWCCAHTSAVGPLRISMSDNNMSSARYLCALQSLPALKLPCTLQYAERDFLRKCFQALCHYCFT